MSLNDSAIECARLAMPRSSFKNFATNELARFINSASSELGMSQGELGQLAQLSNENRLSQNIGSIRKGQVGYEETMKVTILWAAQELLVLAGADKNLIKDMNGFTQAEFTGGSKKVARTQRKTNPVRSYEPQRTAEVRQLRTVYVRNANGTFTPTAADFKTIAKSVWDALEIERANPNNSLREELKQLTEQEVEDWSEKAARAWWNQGGCTGPDSSNQIKKNLRAIYHRQESTAAASASAAAAAPAASAGPMVAAAAAASSGEGPAESLGADGIQDWDA